ncbi:MAG: hypothetical protein ACRBG0_15490 [Lewinella sp.]|jgi:hypothetical protein|uniref:hypothetical protein n=1 Tax=Lewinella sp. TaxID=2004506 RepID=UPI003D6B60AC
MKINHAFFLVLFLCCCNFPLLAQEDLPNSAEGITKLSFVRPEGPTLNDLSNYGKVNRTEGTPYLYDAYTPGRIRFEGQPNFSEMLDVLLDLENNELFVKLSTGFIGEFPLEHLDAVQVYGEKDTLTFEALNMQELFGEGDYGRRFYRVLHRGDRYLLLHQPIKYLRKEDYVENLGMVRRPDKYMERNQYWVFDGASIYEIKSNLRQISKVFPRKAATMKRLVRTHDLNLNNQDDLGRLFALLEEES